MVFLVLIEVCFEDEEQFLSDLRVTVVGCGGLFEPEDSLETANQRFSELLAADESDKQFYQVAIEEFKG